MLVQLLDLNDKFGDRIEKPIEEEPDGDEKRVALALHDPFLVHGSWWWWVVSGGEREANDA